MELEIINRLYLELSQVSTAQTQNEITLTNALSDLLFQVSCAQSETHIGICTGQAEKALEVVK